MNQTDIALRGKKLLFNFHRLVSFPFTFECTGALNRNVHLRQARLYRSNFVQSMNFLVTAFRPQWLMKSWYYLHRKVYRMSYFSTFETLPFRPFRHVNRQNSAHSPKLYTPLSVLQNFNFRINLQQSRFHDALLLITFHVIIMIQLKEMKIGTQSGF